MKKILLLFFLVCLLSTVFAEFEEFDPTTVAEINVDVEISGVLSLDGDIQKADDETFIELRVFTFQENPQLRINSIDEYLMNGNKIIEPEYETEGGNKRAVFKVVPPLSSEMKYYIKANITSTADTFSIKNDYSLDSLSKLTLDSYVSDFLNKSDLVESTSVELKNLATNITTSDSILENILEYTSWTNDYLTYDFAYYDIVRSALETKQSKRGTCDEFSHLTIGLLRSRGIPTRLVAGLIFDRKQWGLHAWLEAYLPSQGWLPIDSTFNEVGMLNATHIPLAYLEDASLFFDQISITSPVSLEFSSELTKELDVKVNSLTEFEGLIEYEIEKKSDYLKSNELNTQKISLNNSTQNYLFIPVNLYLHPDFSNNEQAKLVMLSPGENKDVSFEYKTPSLQNNDINYSYVTVVLGNLDTHYLVVEAKETEQKQSKIETRFDSKFFKDENKYTIYIYLDNIGNVDENVKVSFTRVAPDENKSYTEDVFVKSGAGSTVMYDFIIIDEEEITFEVETSTTKEIKKFKFEKDEEKPVVEDIPVEKKDENVVSSDPVQVESPVTSEPVSPLSSCNLQLLGLISLIGLGVLLLKPWFLASYKSFTLSLYYI